MKSYVAIIAAAIILSGCTSNNVFHDCEAATNNMDDYDACIRESREAQWEAHRIVVKKYMAKS